MLSNISNPTCFFCLTEPLVAHGSAEADVMDYMGDGWERRPSSERIVVHDTVLDAAGDIGFHGRAVRVRDKWVVLEIQC